MSKPHQIRSFQELDSQKQIEAVKLLLGAIMFFIGLLAIFISFLIANDAHAEIASYLG